MSQYTPNKPQNEWQSLPGQPSSPYPPISPPLKPPRKKRSRSFWITVGLIVLVLVIIGGIMNATGSGNPSPSSTASQATQPAQPTHTSAPTPTNTAAPTPTTTPTQGPPRAVIDQIEKELAYPYDPIVESYNQSTATVQVAFKYGYAVVVDPKAVKLVVGDRMKGYFHQYKNVYISKVTVQIYGTVRRGSAVNGYDVIAHATMTRATAQVINWIFASDDKIWNECINTWMDQGVIENA
jgi:hypothetical protein